MCISEGISTANAAGANKPRRPPAIRPALIPVRNAEKIRGMMQEVITVVPHQSWTQHHPPALSTPASTCVFPVPSNRAAVDTAIVVTRARQGPSLPRSLEDFLSSFPLGEELHS